MDGRVVEFSRILRTNGVRVSPAEIQDAVVAAAVVGAEERAAFRAALRVSLVKRARDVPVFDALFDLYFSAPGRALEGLGLDRGLLAELEEQGVLGAGELETIARTLAELAPDLSPLARAALEGDVAAVARILSGAAQQVSAGGLEGPTGAGFRARRLLASAGGTAASEDLSRIVRALRERGLDPSRLELVAERLGAALRRVEEAARRWAEAEGKARAVRTEGAVLAGTRTPITRDEVARAEAAVRRLAERLRTRLARRERSRRRGTLSVRRTLRRNLGLGGIPARIVFRRRHPDRPDVVVLCDVSESVRHVTRLMLLFLYTLQALFTRVRTFVFVSDLAEVTASLRAERDPAKAADLAVAGRAVSLAANSNYGRALRAFHRDFLGAVTRRTTVIVVGDGRNNYNLPEAWVLDELRQKAKRLLWICPEGRYGWGMGDSEMHLYAPRCDRVATVATLEELEDIADALVPGR